MSNSQTHLGMGLQIDAEAWLCLCLVADNTGSWYNFLDAMLEAAGAINSSEQCLDLSSVSLEISPEVLDSELETEPIGL